MRQKSKNKIILIIFSLCFINSILMTRGFNELEIAEQYDDTNNLTFNYVWSNQKAEVDRPKPPNVWNILDNVTHFAEPNHTVYLGDELIPKDLMEGINWTYCLSKR